MASYADQAAISARLLAATPGWLRVLDLHGALDDETAEAIIAEAAKFAEGTIAPLNKPADRTGCRLVDGRVVTPPGYGDAWRTLTGGGWVGMTLPEALGGQGLPLSLQAACQPLFERACIAFMMAPGASDAAAHLLSEAAETGVAQDWVPALLAGERAATICISEPDAGSDVGRLSTRAVLADGTWRVTGSKIWISFGDHDMAARIGHCLLARTGDVPGTRGLSLFLVPNLHEDGTDNGVTVARIEEKLGLHGSPTCALEFDGAESVLLGQEGRGLPQLFSMIERMRLLTGCQGLGLACGAFDTASAYAVERRQGGPPDAPPLPIANHPDIRRHLADMRDRTLLLNAALLELAATMDLARLEPAPEDRQAHGGFAAWMLPMAKTFGAEAGFDVANRAIQVLGGAGYTKEWPLEQTLRDARVLSIYEGTTGMQALDFLERRLWRDEGAGAAQFLKRARAELSGSLGGDTAQRTIGAFEALTKRILPLRNDGARAGADAYMRAAWCAVGAWMLVRLAATGDNPLAPAAIRHRMLDLDAEFTLHAARCEVFLET